MAEFCKQCSLEVWGEDTKDFVDRITEKDVAAGFIAVVTCEGCELTYVDHEGICKNPRCSKHGELR